MSFLDFDGLPKGVVNLVIGKSEEIAQVIMDSKDVRKITFTGSTEVGKHLIRQSADTVKQVSMELGGHAPFIVFDDADLDLAVQGVIGSKFASSGQQCVCTNRVYVQEAVYEEFAEKFKTAVGKMKVGNGLDETNQMGSLVNEKAVNSVHSQVVDAVDKGAKVLVGGKILKGNEYSKGYFYAPTVLGNVTEDMDITKVETFGPVAPLISFVTEAEAVQKANDIEYGLAYYFYTNDLSRVHRVSEKLEYGMVGVNDSAPFSMQAPFGGIKESGLGRESGKYGLEDYLTTKAVSVMFNTEEG